MKIPKLAKNEDIILYIGVDKKGNTKGVNTDKKELQSNQSLDDFYSGTYTQIEIKKEIVNPREVMKGIKDKLTPIELYFFRNYKF